MNEFFGVSTTLIMAVLLAALALSLATVGVVALRHRIVFDIGLRNIGRRRTQSLLIVLGLMLSTAIIAAALATGDTVAYSITNETYTRLGHVDEIVQIKDNQDETSLTDEEIAPPGIIPQRFIDLMYALTNGVDEIDGVLPGLRYPVPAKHHDTETRVPEVTLIGLDETAMQGFEGDIVSRGGAPIDIAQLERDDAVVNESAAAALGLRPGDRVDVYIDQFPRTFNVMAIVKDRVLTGWTQGQPAGILIKLEPAQFLYGTQGYGFIVISNRGGVRDARALTEAVSAPIEYELALTAYELSRIKDDRVGRAEEAGRDMTAIFMVLGLFSIAAGTLLVFLILVMLAAERRPEMGMSRAVGMTRLQLVESFIAEGMAYSLGSAALGAALGVAVSLGMTRAMDYIFSAFDIAVAFHVTPQSLVIAFCLGVVLTFVTVVASAWRVSRLTVVAAIRDQAEPAPRSTGVLSLFIGAALVAAGIALVAYGAGGDRADWFGAGASLAIIGAAFVARSRGAPERAVFTGAGVAVLVLWALVAGDTLRSLTGPLGAGMGAMFVGGVLMVAAATFVVVHNAGLLLGALRGIGFVFGRAAPAVRTAIAYPLANKFRTGMTIAMMSLVFFALVMISTLSLNFRNLFVDPDARGGWDVVVEENPRNPFTDARGNRLGPLGEALDRAFYPTRKIEVIARVLTGNPRSTQIAEVNAEGNEISRHSFVVNGTGPNFLDHNRIGLQARARGYASDADVWRALADTEANFAVIDGSVVPGINYANVTEDRFTLSDYESGDREFEPFRLQIRESSATRGQLVQVIGIMDRGPSETYRGIWVNADTFARTFQPESSRHYIRLQPGADARAEAKEIERLLVEQGVTAESIKDQVDDQQRLSAAFFYLVQGFMALGLGVGLAALSVIAFRTVVERRQQVGLMRAIGFSRANVALSFILESAFIALLGIVNGTWLALLLANRILQSEQFESAGFTGFAIPWLQIAVMAVLVFAASVLTTIIPSRQASSIPIAEAIRYE